MKHSMLERVEVLEALAVRSRPMLRRFGWLASQLPPDYEGERHYVPVNCRSFGSPFIEWCEFEERAGPAPPENQPENPRTSNGVSSKRGAGRHQKARGQDGDE